MLKISRTMGMVARGDLVSNNAGKRHSHYHHQGGCIGDYAFSLEDLCQVQQLIDLLYPGDIHTYCHC